MLLTGSRGTGKSSLVKAMLAKYSARGLRLIEVDKSDLVDLPDIVERVEGLRERFIVFCDDLTSDAGEAGYKALKVALDGSIAGPSGNVVIYATSNVPGRCHENAWPSWPTGSPSKANTRKKWSSTCACG